MRIALGALQVLMLFSSFQLACVVEPLPAPPSLALEADSRSELGTWWDEYEFGRHGTWIRRADSNVFDASWDGITAVLTVTRSGDEVSIARRYSSDRNDCNYAGAVAADGVSVSGTYVCNNGGPYQWRAVMHHAPLASPQPMVPPAPPPPSGTLGAWWDEYESGHRGTWIRRADSNVFDARWGSTTAVLTVTRSGDAVSIARRYSSDRNDCNYAGAVAADGVSVSGTYVCNNGGPYQWRATMHHAPRASPQPAVPPPPPPPPPPRASPAPAPPPPSPPPPTRATRASPGSARPARGTLGTWWDEYESGHHGRWVRRGRSNVFDARWGNTTAVLTITRSGDAVSIARRHSSDGNDCNYTGAVAADGVSVSGTYRCNNGGPYGWRATIKSR